MECSVPIQAAGGPDEDAHAKSCLTANVNDALRPMECMRPLPIEADVEREPVKCPLCGSHRISAARPENVEVDPGGPQEAPTAYAGTLDRRDCGAVIPWEPRTSAGRQKRRGGRPQPPSSSSL